MPRRLRRRGRTLLRGRGRRRLRRSRARVCRRRMHQRLSPNFEHAGRDLPLTAVAQLSVAADDNGTFFLSSQRWAGSRINSTGTKSAYGKIKNQPFMVTGMISWRMAC